MNLYAVSIPTFVRTLTSLKNILMKGEEHAGNNNIDPAVLVNARLFPDMHPLKRQVQIATDSAKRGAARLAEVEPPAFEDSEETFADLYDRIDRTIDFLQTLTEAQFKGAESRVIDLPMGETTMKLDGVSMLMGFALANFSFHVVTAYNILRHNGVVIGKRDYLGAA